MTFITWFLRIFLVFYNQTLLGKMIYFLSWYRMNKNRFIGWSIFVVLLSGFWLSGCKPEGVMVAQVTPSTSGEVDIIPPETILLPTPRSEGRIMLEEALTKRRSVREFSDKLLTSEVLGQLLWSAQGVTHPAGYRTAPSAGALYPLEVYVVTPAGIYHYDPQEHRLNLHQQGDFRPGLHSAALKQDAVLNAPAVFIIAAVYERTEVKYGIERGPRYVHLEAGHAAQNLLLQVVALDLGAVPIGAFYDGKVIEALSLPDDHQPLYLIPVGHPK